MGRRYRYGAVFALALLGGCAVGPDFLSPKVDDGAGFTPEKTLPPTSASDVPGGASQTFAPGGEIPAQWWELFHSPALNGLIEQAFKANPDLRAAEAALRQAEELALAQGGVLYPQVNGNFNGQREQVPPAQSGVAVPKVYNLTSASLSISYALDVFGGNRRAVEAAEAQADFQRYQLQAAYLTLSSNLVSSAVQEASLRGQIVATKEIAEAEQRQLDVVRRQFDLGGASRTDVLAEEATLAQTLANLPALEKQLAQQRNRLTVLAGRYPSNEILERFDLAALQLPRELPVSLPSALVEQRPDVQAATATLHQASAEVGVAIANQLPQISLTAQWGSAANAFGDLFSGGTGLWSAGFGLVQPIFRGGQLQHERRAAEAAYERAAAQYKSTVLGAFRDVADALRALQADADRLRAQLAAERSAAGSLALAREQYAAGAISYLTLLNAENTFHQAHIILVQAEAARFADTAALFQALGGGWWSANKEAASKAVQP